MKLRWKLLSLVAIVALLAGCGRGGSPLPTPQPKAGGGDVVGNGGNPSLALWFSIAEKKAPQIVARTDRGTVGEGFPPAVVEWIFKHKRELKKVLEATHYEWTRQPQERCALAVKDDKRVELYFPACLTSVSSLQEAAEVVVHEAIHHLSVDDEGFISDLVSAFFKGTRYLLYFDEGSLPKADSEADLVCASEQAELDFEQFNGNIRVRFYRFEAGQRKFEARYNCSDLADEVSTIVCEEPREKEKGYRIVLQFAPMAGYKIAAVRAKGTRDGGVDVRCPN